MAYLVFYLLLFL